MKLYELITRSARAALEAQDTESGSFRPGHNGPYHDEETPVRNTAHWLIVLLKAHSITGEESFLRASERAVGYLAGERARPMDRTFWHRKNPDKDSCNGLIGQAWTIEALVTAGKAMEKPHCLDLAEKVYLLHPYSPHRNVWRRVAADGMYLTIDMTFNHQLWFAMVGGLIVEATGNEEINKQVNGFLDRLDEYLVVYGSGLIYHPLRFTANAKDRVKRVIKWARQNKEVRDNLKTKAVGYHSFNLYALSVLKRVLPNHGFWNSGSMTRLFDYAASLPFRNQIMTNPYGFPYNPPGLEMALAIQEFEPYEDNQAEIRRWLELQFKETYDPETDLMNRRASDPNTCAARIYEAVRLDNYEVPLD